MVNDPQTIVQTEAIVLKHPAKVAPYGCFWEYRTPGLRTVALSYFCSVKSRNGNGPGNSGSNRNGRGKRTPGAKGTYGDKSGKKKDFKKSSGKGDFNRSPARGNKWNSEKPDGKDREKRSRTRKYLDKDRELIGDWRSERPGNPKERREEREREYNPIKEETRLNKYLANAGLCSRRDADAFIENGQVTINGQIAKELGTKVQPGDEVRFKGRLILPEKPVYVLINKPKDCITSAEDPEGRRTVMDLIDNSVRQRIFPVGRLDRNTTGVLLLTNDGDLAQKLTHPSFGVHKVYKATLDKAMKREDFEKLLAGVELEDGFVQPDAMAYVDETQKEIGIEIHSGKNRVVHRMFNSLGYLVDKLDRVMFAGLSKDGLKRGETRQLTDKEVQLLRKVSGKRKA